MIDAQTSNDGDQESSGGSNLVRRSLLPTNKSFLEHILCVSHASRHAVGDGEQKSAILLERRQPARILRIVWLPSSPFIEFVTVSHTFPIPAVADNKGSAKNTASSARALLRTDSLHRSGSKDYL
jgi:hypothetical protein